MFDVQHPEAYWSAIVIQTLGVISLLLARLNFQGRVQLFFQRQFCCVLLAVGGATMMSIACGSDYWLSYAITMSLMSLGAILDFGQAGQTATW